MKQILRKVDNLCLMSLGLLMFASCSEEEMGSNVPEPKPEIVKVSFQAGSGDQKTKIWYEQDDTKFKANWLVGDKVSILNSGFEKEDAQAPFEAKSEGEAPKIDGELTTWTDKRTLYAVHPHKDDYYGFDGKSFLYSAAEQKIDVNPDKTKNSQAVNNSILLAVAENAGFKVGANGKNGLDVDRLWFKQAMSFLKFELGEVPEGYTIKTVTITDKELTLVERANISISHTEAGDVIDYTNKKYTNSITASIVGHKAEKNVEILFALIPTELKNAQLVVMAVDGGGNEHKYTKQLPALDFKRNEFNFYSKTLEIGTDGFDSEEEVPGIGDSMVGWSPADGEFVLGITELTNSTVGLDYLKVQLLLTRKDIKLICPNLVRVEGSEIFNEFKYIEEIQMPLVKVVGDRTFWGCEDLKAVYMPSLEKAGKETFGVVKDKDIVVDFTAATNSGIVLQYGEDSGDKRVNLHIGNKELYSGKENGSTITLSDGEKDIKHTFRNITWE